MPPFHYDVLCYEPGCGRPARFKIAARWSDQQVSELKTYGLTCEVCLARWFHRSLAKHQACRLTEGESLERPRIFAWQPGTRDVQLTPLPDLEKSLLD